jgi:hypothetical protein
MEEQIALMRRLWTEELIDFEGRDHTVHQAGINPPPVQRPIPVWMGGGADTVLDRIARVADGWFPQFPPGPQGAEQIAKLRAHIRAAGRAEDAVGIEGRISLANMLEPEWGGLLEGWRGLGATHVSLNTMYAKLASPQSHIDALRHFMDVARP